MATHRISVTMNPTSIQVSPETLTMTAADEVYWEGYSPKKFSIAFEGTGPFPQARLSHSAAIERTKPVRRGSFKYTVISDEDPSVKLDPVIIVEDPPTGPNP